MQDKLVPSMTMQEQARLSGLEFLDDSSLEPQWSTTREEYPPLLEGWRWGHASVVVENDNEVQSIVVLGGTTEGNLPTDSVFVWDSSTKQWRQGPSLNEKRRVHAAETCKGKFMSLEEGMAATMWIRLGSLTSLPSWLFQSPATVIGKT